MNVVHLPPRERVYSVMDGAPHRAADSPFMGFVETIAWVALRDEPAALAARWHSLDRPDLDGHWIGAAWAMLTSDIADQGGSIRGIEQKIADQCALGALKAKGRGNDGFDDIPDNDWLNAKLLIGEKGFPDTILINGTNKGWSHVCFRREDVFVLWPERVEETADAAQPTPPLRARHQTNKRPPWYPVLRSMMEDEHRRIEELAEKKPDLLPPAFPTAVAFRNRLKKTFPENTLAPSKVRYHVANIKVELGR